MELNLDNTNALFIKPMVATLIIIGYYAGLFNGVF